MCLVTQRALRAGFARPAASPEAAGPNPWFARKEFLHRLDQRLRLTPEQHERIARMLEDSQERTRALMRPISPEMQSIVREVRQKIRAELTPEQAAKYDEMLQHNRQPRPGESREDRKPGQHRRFPATNQQPAGATNATLESPAPPADRAR